MHVKYDYEVKCEQIINETLLSLGCFTGKYPQDENDPRHTFPSKIINGSLRIPKTSPTVGVGSRRVVGS